MAEEKWKCNGCMLRWDHSKIKCEACEAWKPGLSDEDLKKFEEEEKRQKQAVLDIFRPKKDSGEATGSVFGGSGASIFGGSSAAPAAGGGISFGFGGGGSTPSAPAAGGFTFGVGAGAADSSASSGSAAPAPLFGFGAGTGGGSSAPSGGGFTFGFGGGGGGADSAASSAAGGGFAGFGTTFGSGATSLFGSAGGSSASGGGGLGGGGFMPVFNTPAAPVEKKLAKLPDFAQCAGARTGPLADVFVHGSGECDQLGLGDDLRERKKPALVKKLQGQQVVDLAVGALHVVVITSKGGLYSWGCNDDGALGRATTTDDENSDCEPRIVPLPAGVMMTHVCCGDNHTCALDTLGRAWLWGTYKDSNGHIGLSRKRSHDPVDKSHEPEVILEGCKAIASGSNHTLALKQGPGKTTSLFSWGSNSTGQLALEGNAGCGFEEKQMKGSDAAGKLKARTGGGCEIDGQHVVRIRDSSGKETVCSTQSVAQLQSSLQMGASAIMEVPEREVTKAEKRKLLTPQAVTVANLDGAVEGVFATGDCTFVTTESKKTYGCGLNGDGQVGLGYISMCVKTLKLLPDIPGASHICGGTHSTAALVGTKVFAWGLPEQCGNGSSSKQPQLKPQEVAALPAVRALRCGGHHYLACTEAGDVFVWGCGLTHQLGNRPRDVTKPDDKDEDPDDELRPYCISSKQLEKRFVLLADGGAQHSVELAWTGEYGPRPTKEVILATTGAEPAKPQAPAEQDAPPAKKRAVAAADDKPKAAPAAEPLAAAVSTPASSSAPAGAALAAPAPGAGVEAMETAVLEVARRISAVGDSVADRMASLEGAMLGVASRMSAAADRLVKADASASKRIEVEVLRCFAGGLASEFSSGVAGSSSSAGADRRTLWSARPATAAALGAATDASKATPLTERDRAAFAANVACMDRSQLEKLVLELASRDAAVQAMLRKQP
eukprot:TRINITY_DN16772_c0_g1_i1.p1 TRINITY_DN16772_c0_g1~~TRINITY_DN16772_c0_g1_i1.p1  ORF type:complete len:946 (-),score=266.38 TRINITY_DN16772_c0_g1_i1:108-2945(-)